MSDYFITNITGTGVPTTGNPTDINNNGGIENAPQNKGNVSNNISASGVDNDVSISGSEYNANGGTDAQEIGPSANNPISENRSKPTAQVLTNSRLRNNNCDDPLQVCDYTASSLTPVYRSTFDISSSSNHEEGEVIGKPNSTSFVYAVGGFGGPTVVSQDIYDDIRSILNEDDNDCKNKGPGLIDEPCEIVLCDGKIDAAGKKLRVFHGQGCQGTFPQTPHGKDNIPRSGYWIQASFPSQSMSNDDLAKYGNDCSTFESSDVKRPLVSIAGNKNIRKDRSCDCQNEIIASGGISGANMVNEKVDSHLLYYVGTSITGIKNEKWCNFEDKPSPLDPSGTRMSGYQEWFYEGSHCNADGTRNDVANAGKLFGCCYNPHNGSADNPGAELYVLTEVDSIVINSSDDPCDCYRRKLAGVSPEFLPIQAAAANSTDSNECVFVTGCTKNQAIVSGMDPDITQNYYVAATGDHTPIWNSGECAWDIKVQAAVRCPGSDQSFDWKVPRLASEGYCPSGPIITMTDRSLFCAPFRILPGPHPSYFNNGATSNHINYSFCSTGDCNSECTVSDALFDLGDYVNISSVLVTGLLNVPALQNNIDPYRQQHWAQQEVFDISKSGADGFINGPFSTGDEPGTSGCNILTNSWRVVGRGYGGDGGSPSSWDCSWGYMLEFTGCAPCSGGTPIACAEGRIPGTNLFMPEAQITSGEVCTRDSDCPTPCVSGDSLFEVGDYVNLTPPQGAYRSGLIEGYENQNGSWSGQFFIDLFVANSGHTASQPFSSGCEAGDQGLCNWVFNQTDPSVDPPTAGYWTLMFDDCACDADSCQVRPDPNYLGAQNDPTGIGCDTVSGCDIFTNSWKITSKAYGDTDSVPNSIDCTWGYGVEFVGCASGNLQASGTCAATGSAPASAYQYIPEVFFSSGTAC
tara:strand:+ start:363 stop:3113 length:2751 start_codon:yes stop_codon:yes gene_type:complete